MAKLLLSYPVVAFHQLEVEVSDQKADEVIDYMNLDEKALFITAQNEEQDTLQQITNFNSLVHALDVGYATIKRID